MARKFGRYLEEVAELAETGRRRVEKIAYAPVDAAATATAWTGKKMVRDTEPGIANLWTGKRESKTGIAVAGVIAAGYGTYGYMRETTFAPKLGEVSYGGTAPVMDADGVGSTTNAPTLNAGGNMVFGLHNARKG